MSNILQAKTEEAVRSIVDAGDAVRTTNAALAAVVGLELPPRPEATTIPEALAGFVAELGLTTEVFQQFTAQVTAAHTRTVAALRPVALPAADVPAGAEAMLEGVNRLPVEQPAEAEEKGKRKRVTATNGKAH